MKDIELECVPSWRYCHVREGEKAPYPAGWQNQPRMLQQILSNNVGLLLGPQSGGVVALDFDGPSAFAWFDATFSIDLPGTVAWTSGKDGRCQMAFWVPEEYWPYIRTQKIATGEREGWEFRWAGGQSVVPPSRLADGRSYTWVLAPSTTGIAPLPDPVLAWVLEKCQNINQVNTIPDPIVDPAAIDETRFREVVEMLTELQQHTPRLPYDDWLKIAFATAKEIGNAAAELVLKQIWPEQHSGEYQRLLAGRDHSRSPGIGSLVYRLNQTRRNRHTERYAQYLQHRQEIAEIRRILQQKEANEKTNRNDGSRT